MFGIRAGFSGPGPPSAYDFSGAAKRGFDPLLPLAGGGASTRNCSILPTLKRGQPFDTYKRCP